MPFKLVLALSMFTMTAHRAARLLVTLYALKLGAQPFAVGVLAAMFAMFPATLAVPIGILVDRIGSRWPLLIGSGGLVLSVMVPYYFPALPAMYVAAVLIGMSFAFYNVTLQNLVGLMSDKSTRTKNYSNFGMGQAIAASLGPLLAGVGIDHAGYGATCLLIAVSILVSVVALIGWGGVLPASTQDATSSGNILHTLKDRRLLRVLATSSLVVTGIELFLFYMPIYGHAIGLSATSIGLILAMYSAAAFVVRLLMTFLLRGLTEERLLAYSFYFSAATLVLFPFFQNVAALALIAFLFGLGTGCGQPITMMLTFGNTSQGRSGAVMGIRIMVNQLTRIAIPVIFGSIGSAFGMFPVFWTNAAMLASGGLLSRPDAEETKKKDG